MGFQDLDRFLKKNSKHLKHNYRDLKAPRDKL